MESDAAILSVVAASTSVRAGPRLRECLKFSPSEPSLLRWLIKQANEKAQKSKNQVQSQ
jgi:hypothetical protein